METKTNTKTFNQELKAKLAVQAEKQMAAMEPKPAKHRGRRKVAAEVKKLEKAAEKEPATIEPFKEMEKPDTDALEKWFTGVCRPPITAISEEKTKANYYRHLYMNSRQLLANFEKVIQYQTDRIFDLENTVDRLLEERG